LKPYLSGDRKFEKSLQKLVKIGWKIADQHQIWWKYCDSPWNTSKNSQMQIIEIQDGGMLLLNFQAGL